MEASVAAAGFMAFFTEMFAPLLLCSSIPLGSPPVADPALGRVAPEQCILYVGWAGIGTPDPKSKNSAERFLADPEIRRLRAEALRRFRLLCKASAKTPTTAMLGLDGDGSKIVSDDAALWCELFVSQPCAFFVTRYTSTPETSDYYGGFVMNVGDSREKVAAMLKHYRELAKGTIEETTVDGCTEYRLKSEAAGSSAINLRWSLREKYLIVALGDESPSGIAKRMNGPEPEWFAAIAKDLPIERRAAVVKFNVKPLVEELADNIDPDVAKQLAASHLRSLTLVTGLDAEDFAAHVFVETDKIGSALLQAANRPVKIDDLSVIPRDATLALAGRVDPKFIAGALLWMKENLRMKENTEDPKKISDKDGENKDSENDDNAADSIYATGGIGSDVMRMFGIYQINLLEHLWKGSGFDVDEKLCADLAASIGDTWRLYTSPSEGSSILSGFTGVVRMKDGKKFVEICEKLVARGPQKTWAVRKTRFADHDVYYLVRSGEDAVGVLTWSLAENELVWSLGPANVKAYLLHEPGVATLAGEPALAEAFRSKQTPTVLFYEDSREMFRLTYPLMQGFASAAATKAALPTDGIDPMLLPAAPTIAKYLRPAVSTVEVTPRGVHVALHQSLPNGNLGATLYVVALSLLPENPNAFSDNEDDKKQGEEKKDGEKKDDRKSPEPEKKPVAQLKTFTEKEGPCSLKDAKSHEKAVKIELGKNIQGDCRFYIDEFFGKTIINANISVKNTSKERRNCQYYVAFFDKDGKLVGCAEQGLGDDGLAAGKDTNMCSCLIYLPDGAAETVASYKVRLYETDPIAEKKKKKGKEVTGGVGECDPVKHVWKSCEPLVGQPIAPTATRALVPEATGPVYPSTGYPAATYSTPSTGYSATPSYAPAVGAAAPTRPSPADGYNSATPGYSPTPSGYPATSSNAAPLPTASGYAASPTPNAYTAPPSTYSNCAPYCVPGMSPQAAPKLKLLTKKDGPCTLKTASSSYNEKNICRVEVGQHLRGVCKFYISDVLGRPTISAGIEVTNPTNLLRGYQYCVAFYDKAGELIGCSERSDTRMMPGCQSDDGCVIFLPDDVAETVASYKIRFYESDATPGK